MEQLTTSRGSFPTPAAGAGRGALCAGPRETLRITAPGGPGHCRVSGTSSAVRDLPSTGMGQAAPGRAVSINRCYFLKRFQGLFLLCPASVICFSASALLIDSTEFYQDTEYLA